MDTRSRRTRACRSWRGPTRKNTHDRGARMHARPHIARLPRFQQPATEARLWCNSHRSRALSTATWPAHTWLPSPRRRCSTARAPRPPPRTGRVQYLGRVKGGRLQPALGLAEGYGVVPQELWPRHTRHRSGHSVCRAPRHCHVRDRPAGRCAARSVHIAGDLTPAGAGGRRGAGARRTAHAPPTAPPRSRSVGGSQSRHGRRDSRPGGPRRSGHCVGPVPSPAHAHAAATASSPALRHPGRILDARERGIVEGTRFVTIEVRGVRARHEVVTSRVEHFYCNRKAFVTPVVPSSSRAELCLSSSVCRK